VFFAGLNVDDVDKEMGQYEKDLFEIATKNEANSNALKIGD
jgi:hypothetical protein